MASLPESRPGPYWPLYELAVYWTLPDDGAKIRCKECKQQKSFTEVLLTQIPKGDRAVLCKECIDDDWLELAVDMGAFPE